MRERIELRNDFCLKRVVRHNNGVKCVILGWKLNGTEEKNKATTEKLNLDSILDNRVISVFSFLGLIIVWWMMSFSMRLSLF